MEYLKRYQTKSNNCFSTCVANLLFLTDEQLNAMPPHDCDDWSSEYQNHLKQYNIQLLIITVKNLDHLPDTACIITGVSSYSGIPHSVIGNRGQILFDPLRKGTGLQGDYTEWKYCFLIPIQYRELPDKPIT